MPYLAELSNMGFRIGLTVWCSLLGVLAAYDQPAVYQLNAKDQIFVLGDSTTADGLRVAGYVLLVDQALREQLPDQGISVAGDGRPMKTAGSMVGPRGTVEGVVKPRMQKGPAPTVVIINFGLNDSKEGEKGIAQYTDNLRQAITQLREQKLTVLLCTPTTWGGLTQTKPYAEAARAIAVELKCPLIDLYSVHADHITANTKDGKRLPGTNPTRDGTHMTILGETLSATAILQAFGLKPMWQNFQLRTAVARRGKGKITVTPESPTYAPGTKVTLTVETEPGFTCFGWTNLTSDVVPAEKSPTLTVTMDRHQWYEADIRPEEAKKP